MAIREFMRNVGEKILPDRAQGQSGSGKQQQQFSGTQAGQQASTAGGSSAQGGAARGSGGSSQSQGGTAAKSGSGTPSAADKQAQDAIVKHIRDNVADAPDDLVVVFDAEDGLVIITGTVADDETAELVILTTGNIEGVAQVDDRMTRAGAAGSSTSGSRGSQDKKSR